MRQSNINFKYKMLHDSNSLTSIRHLYPLEDFREAVKSQACLVCKCLSHFPAWNSHQNWWPYIPCLMHKKNYISLKTYSAPLIESCLEYHPPENTALWSTPFCDYGDGPSSSPGSRDQHLSRGQGHTFHTTEEDFFSFRTKLCCGGVLMNTSG